MRVPAETQCCVGSTDLSHLLAQGSTSDDGLRFFLDLEGIEKGCSWRQRKRIMGMDSGHGDQESFIPQQIVRPGSFTMRNSHNSNAPVERQSRSGTSGKILRKEVRSWCIESLQS